MKKILLVEDDPFLADIYSAKIKKAGFEISVVKDGGEVLDAVREKKPDLLLLDIVLPHLDGWEIARQIKESDDIKDLKIIMLSSLSQKNEIEKGLESGVLKYLIKSHYTPTEIVKEIKKALS